MSKDVLEHHGILGMKWGIRRYQTRSGSLTPAGKKHLSQRKSSGGSGGKPSGKKKIKKAVNKPEETKPAEAKPAKPENSEPNSRPVKGEDVAKLSDAELNARVNRLNQEVRYYENLNKLAQYNRPQLTRGDKMKKAVGQYLYEGGGDLAKTSRKVATGVIGKELGTMAGEKTVEYLRKANKR